MILLTSDLLNKTGGSITQQTKTVSGKVTDSSGSPLPGVTVVLKGTTGGTITEANGNYSLSNVPADAVLVFSFVGMKTQEVSVEGKSTINVRLLEETIGIEEVVAVGYGTQKKSDLTGSIVSVKSEDIKNLPVRSVTEALQGRVAGVMINKDSGKPGSSSEIIIRGVGSINGLNPLFIIDGVARENNATFNPRDVESIEIIKDASAAAIYGAQAAGGVVLITTKRGNYNEKASIEFTANTGIRDISKSYKMLETKDYIRARQGIGENYGLWNNPAELPNTNWFDELFESGLEQSYLLSARGGTKNVSYYLSAGYEREDGIQKDNFWERYSIRLNNEYKLGKKFTLGHQLYMARVGQNPATRNVPWRSLPYMAVYNDDGTFARVPSEVEFSGGNDVASLAYYHYKSRDLLLQGNLYADWEIIDGLNLRVTGSGGFASGYDDEFNEKNELTRTPVSETYTKSSNYSESYVLTSVLTYAKVFAKVHDFKVMAGYEIKKSNTSSLEATATSFPVRVSESFALSTNPNRIASGALRYGRYLSQFGRLNYAFKNRYLLTANIRRDGSPKFGPNNRWGVFPSLSAGWKISEEPFFKNQNWEFIDVLKPRVSWGKLGNDSAIGNFAYEPSYQQLTLHSFDEVTKIGGFNTIKVANASIKWEEIQTLDAGIDVGMFKNRLTASVEYYSRQTKDMLYNLTIPYGSGIGKVASNPTSMPVNIGQISNKGWEISLSYRNKTGDLNYSVSGNLSHNKNKVIDLGLPTAYIYSGGVDFMSGQSPFKTVNGQPVGRLYGLIAEGIIQNQQEIDDLNAKATQIAGKTTYYNNQYTGPGDLKHTDLSGDGKISDADRTFIGNPWPKYQYGFDIQLEWKGIDFSAQIVGIEGRDVFNGVKTFEQSFVQDYQSTYSIFNASYFLDNGLTDQPRVGLWNPVDPSKYIKDPSGNYKNYSSYFVEDGSYLKIKNISLGYTIPNNVLERFGIQRLRLYLSGQNLFTFTKFTGLDPEFSNNVKNHGLYTYTTYPQTKLVSLGMELNF